MICCVHFIFSVLHQVQVIKQYSLYPLSFPGLFISIFPYFPFVIQGPQKVWIKSVLEFGKFSYCTLLKIYSKTEMYPRLATVPLATSYHLDFLHISKVQNVVTSHFVVSCFVFYSFSFLLLGYTYTNFKSLPIIHF